MHLRHCTRLAVTTLLSAGLAVPALALGGAAQAAPGRDGDTAAARPVDIVGASGPEIGTPAQDHRTGEFGTFVYSTGEGWGFGGDHVKVGLRLTSMAPLTMPSGAGMAYLALDGQGRAAWITGYVEDQFYPEKSSLIAGPWRGLRTIIGAGTMGDASAGRNRSTLLYAVTNGGGLVRIAVSWAGRRPVFGKPQLVVSRGFAQVADVEWGSWSGRNWVPTEDRLVGVTKQGSIVEWTVTRAAKPKVTTRVLARSGYAGAVSIDEDQYPVGGDGAVVWVLRRADGSACAVMDPHFGDHSFKGAKALVRWTKADPNVRGL